MRRVVISTRHIVTVGLVLWTLAAVAAETTANNDPVVTPSSVNAESNDMADGSCADPSLSTQNETKSAESHTNNNEELLTTTPNAQEKMTRTLEDADQVLEESEEEEDFEEEEEEYSGPGSEFGVAQEIEESEEDEESEDSMLQAVSERLDQTYAYMEDNIWALEYYQQFPKCCWNHDPLCTYWAAAGECEANKDFMVESCAPACGACDLDPHGPGASVGKVQLVDFENATFAAQVHETIAATEDYVTNVVQQDDFYTKVRTLCYNRHPQCSQWVVEDLCTDEEEEEYMNLHCAAACQSCEMLHYETRCPVDPEEFPDIWQPGDLNKLFERLVHETPEYNVTVHSSPSLLPGDTEDTAEYFVDGPWIITIDDFITPEEAATLVQWGYGKYERSEEVGGVDPETGEFLEGVVSEDRTSRNAWCRDECAEYPVVQEIFQRIENITGVPAANSESLQLLRCKRWYLWLVSRFCCLRTR